VLSVENIITKSSNIGAAKIGIQMGESRLYQYIRDFGFGTSTGLPLPGEARGLVYPVKKWYKVSLAQIPMGHGIAVTPLQMTMAMGAIANGGTLMRPMLIDRMEDADGTILARFGPQALRQVMTPATARQMVEALKTVVTGDGTAARAKLDSFTVAGKTGTAQKPEPDGTYSKTKFFSSFIGFFPADKPDLCISVVIDEPKNGHYGGQTAAPVFKNIAERAARYLNIKPDVQLDPGTNETLAVSGGNFLR
jgi:cell division protein FtsI/penicillin-binding protein 2